MFFFNASQVPVQVLAVSHTQLETFDGDTFYRFSSLEKLDVSHSHVQFISSEGFTQFPSLQELDLRGNSLEDF
jgi:Leucine-rich repeat (LRR) protein